jgi:hypothetical protein
MTEGRPGGRALCVLVTVISYFVAAAAYAAKFFPET